MEAPFEYYAFISYKREDEKWAKWLQNKLESYKLPSSLPVEDGKEYPKTFHPCFRDKTDLSETGDLSQILHDKLQKSQYLIVICSPRSAKSKWVNKEVETFQAMEKADKIIPFIIEGTPDISNLDSHCYPLSLNENILGISIPEVGKEKAAVKTIAAMLNINFDTLWNRHRERVWKRRIRIAIFSIIFITLFSGFSTWQSLKISEQKNKIQQQSENLQKTNEELSDKTQKLELSNEELNKKTQELQLSNEELDKSNQELEEKNRFIENQNKEIKNQRDRAEQALAHANKLINAFYFYDGKFALAYKDSKFYFIDKEGNAVEKLDSWDKLEYFDEKTGFAKVTYRMFNLVCLMDTLGNKYKYSNNINDMDYTTRALDLRYQQLSKFPSGVCDLTNLRILDISGNKFKELPLEIGNLTKLIWLDLSGNAIINLPPEIGNLTKLTCLNLEYNNIISLPPEIGKLINLVKLNLSGNKLTSLQIKIENLTKLTELNLSWNKITNLPPEIGKLVNLTWLDLRYNNITSLPLEIVKLKKLTKLDLNGNGLTSLPPEIGNLTNLESLSLSHTNITNLPQGIWKLTNLTGLNLSENKIINLPQVIWKLTKLTELNLSNNNFTNLPPEIGKLINLTKLDLDGNELTSLPPEIGNLTNLKYLDLSNTNITSLPPEIEKLTELCYIKCKNTPLDNISQIMVDKINKNSLKSTTRWLISTERDENYEE